MKAGENKKIKLQLFTIIYNVYAQKSYIGKSKTKGRIRVCLNFKLLKTKHLALGLEDEVWNIGML